MALSSDAALSLERGINDIEDYDGDLDAYASATLSRIDEATSTTDFHEISDLIYRLIMCMIIQATTLANIGRMRTPTLARLERQLFALSRLSQKLDKDGYAFVLALVNLASLKYKEETLEKSHQLHQSEPFNSMHSPDYEEIFKSFPSHSGDELDAVKAIYLEYTSKGEPFHSYIS